MKTDFMYNAEYLALRADIETKTKSKQREINRKFGMPSISAMNIANTQLNAKPDDDEYVRQTDIAQLAFTKAVLKLYYQCGVKEWSTSLQSRGKPFKGEAGFDQLLEHYAHTEFPEIRRVFDDWHFAIANMIDEAEGTFADEKKT